MTEQLALDLGDVEWSVRRSLAQGALACICFTLGKQSCECSSFDKGSIFRVVSVASKEGLKSGFVK